jgi:hypothetical protein
LALSKEQEKALSELGVEPACFADFERGEWAKFSFPTRGGDAVEGFARLDQGELISQIFWVSNPDPQQAAKAFLVFLRRTVALARALRLREAELQGGEVINDDVATHLENSGFVKKKIPAPGALGGGTQEVYWKKVSIQQKVKP